MRIFQNFSKFLRNILSALRYDKAIAAVRAEALRQGREEGRAEGRAEARAEGKAEGFEEGRRVGIKEGFAEGGQLGWEEGRKYGIREGKEIGLAMKRDDSDDDNRAHRKPPAMPAKWK